VLWKQEILQFSHDTQFKKLEILNFQQVNRENATVTFIAHLLQNQRGVFLKEKSFFLKSKKKWLYLDAEFIS
jgi:SEC-C motif-containing protein